MILLPPGGTRLDVAWEPSGPSGRVERIVMPRIGIAAAADPSGRLGLEARVVLVKNLVPLFLAATVGTDGTGVLSTLFFGPVRIDWGRTWGRAPGRWGTAQLSASPHLSMLFGVKQSEDRLGAFLGLRIFPAGHGLWEIGFSGGLDGIRLSVGSVAW
jgi:hypothetical protein